MKRSQQYLCMLELLYSMGADYLSQDSLMLLERILDLNVFKNNLAPESAIMIFMRERYSSSNVSFDNTYKLSQM